MIVFSILKIIGFIVCSYWIHNDMKLKGANKMPNILFMLGFVFGIIIEIALLIKLLSV